MADERKRPVAIERVTQPRGAYDELVRYKREQKPPEEWLNDLLIEARDG